MLFAVLTLLTALAMAACAAWFAIAGIMAVFAGAPIPALVMGVVIEAGKLVGVSWIYKHWQEKTLLKYVMLPAVVIAMLLTSMGIFGFLSKAHLEQSAPVGNNAAQIERLDQRIAREQAKITDAETVVAQLDETVQTLINRERISGPDGARAVRAGQQQQRDELTTQINEAEMAISTLQDERFALSQELRELELEVGPVKYIAELIYTEPQDKLEDAVRVVIILFIFVFDPMAILLLMGANYSLLKRRKPTVTAPDPIDPIIEVVDAKTIEDSQTPGEELINLIDEADQTQVSKEQPPEAASVTPAKPVYVSEITDENLIERFKSLAHKRNIPWDIAKRAKVTTIHKLLGEL